MSYLPIHLRDFITRTSIIISFLCFSNNTLCQNVIEGNIYDSNGIAIPKATVSLVNQNNLILLYTIANLNGHYKISISSVLNPDTVLIEVSAVGYKTISKKIDLREQSIDFILTIEVKKLKPVVVKHQKTQIEISNDTITYNVASFRNKKDNFIIDIIRKLPGIEVEPLGKIKYNGRAISNLYIDGDNLLDDKYNLATNSLPNLLVDKIQIIENDQPIKVLQKVKKTDNIALNLVLNEKAKVRLFGTAGIGAGLDNLVEGDITAMMFKKKIKFINSAKTNNIGNDLKNEIISHNASVRLNEMDESTVNPLLNLNYNNTDLDTKRTLFNNTTLLNTNNLFILKRDVKFRANIFYLFDDNRSWYQNDTKIFILNDTIQYKENETDKIKSQIAYSQLNLEINKPKYYLSNSLMTKYDNQNGYSNLFTSGNIINQNLTGNSNEFYNEFKLIRTFNKNKIVEIHSFIKSKNQPQALQIRPGLYEAILNNNNTYVGLTQRVFYPYNFTNNYVSLTIGKSKWQQQYKMGFITDTKKLISFINTRQKDNKETLAPSDFANNFEFKENKIFFEINNNWTSKNEKMKIQFLLPFKFQNIYYKKQNDTPNVEKHFLSVNPNFNVSYKFNEGLSVFAKMSLSRDINSLEQSYQGYILTSYRNFNNNDLPINQDSKINIMGGFTFKNNLNLSYFNTTILYNSIKLNYIPSETINDDVEFISNITGSNSNKSYQISSEYGKYIFSLLSSLKIRITTSLNNQDLFQNNIPFQIKNYSFDVKGSLETKISDKLISDYTFLARLMQNKSMNTTQTSGVNIFAKDYFIQQQLKVRYFPLENFNIGCNNEYFYSNKNNYYFSDVTVNYKIGKKGMEFFFKLTNLFNIKYFTSFTLYSNSLTTNSYSIRSRMAILKFIFNF